MAGTYMWACPRVASLSTLTAGCWSSNDGTEPGAGGARPLGLTTLWAPRTPSPDSRRAWPPLLIVPCGSSCWAPQVRAAGPGPRRLAGRGAAVAQQPRPGVWPANAAPEHAGCPVPRTHLRARPAYRLRGRAAPTSTRPNPPRRRASLKHYPARRIWPVPAFAGGGCRRRRKSHRKATAAAGDRRVPARLSRGCFAITIWLLNVLVRRIRRCVGHPVLARGRLALARPGDWALMVGVDADGVAWRGAW